MSEWLDGIKSTLKTTSATGTQAAADAAKTATSKTPTSTTGKPAIGADGKEKLLPVSTKSPFPSGAGGTGGDPIAGVISGDMPGGAAAGGKLPGGKGAGSANWNINNEGLHDSVFGLKGPTGAIHEATNHFGKTGDAKPFLNSIKNLGGDVLSKVEAAIKETGGAVTSLSFGGAWNKLGNQFASTGTININGKKIDLGKGGPKGPGGKPGDKGTGKPGDKDDKDGKDGGTTAGGAKKPEDGNKLIGVLADGSKDDKDSKIIAVAEPTAGDSKVVAAVAPLPGDGTVRTSTEEGTVPVATVVEEEPTP